MQTADVQRIASKERAAVCTESASGVLTFSNAVGTGEKEFPAIWYRWKGRSIPFVQRLQIRQHLVSDRMRFLPTTEAVIKVR
jgi:hypothetical protein